MKKDDISRLLQHYLSAKEEGKEPYFDADQIDEMFIPVIPPCKSRKAGNSRITRIMRALSLCSRI